MTIRSAGPVHRQIWRMNGGNREVARYLFIKSSGLPVFLRFLWLVLAAPTPVYA
jgi:hypothetical protein